MENLSAIVAHFERKLPRPGNYRKKTTERLRSNLGKLDHYLELCEGRRDFTFSGKIAIFEKWAIQILQDAGLPTDPAGFYSIPDGEPTTPEEIRHRPPPWQGGRLLDLVAARRKREREHKDRERESPMQSGVQLSKPKGDAPCPSES
jgi:hypothetical protein